MLFFYINDGSWKTTKERVALFCDSYLFIQQRGCSRFALVTFTVGEYSDGLMLNLIAVLIATELVGKLSTIFFRVRKCIERLKLKTKSKSSFLAYKSFIKLF